MFVADHRRLLEYCNFGESLAKMLHDRLVCGIKEDQVQCHLLAKSNVTFEKAYELAQAMKPANHETKELIGMPAATVNKLNRDTPKRSLINARLTPHNNTRNSCYHCGGKHPVSDCRF